MQNMRVDLETAVRIIRMIASGRLSKADIISRTAISPRTFDRVLTMLESHMKMKFSWRWVSMPSRKAVYHIEEWGLLDSKKF